MLHPSYPSPDQLCLFQFISTSGWREVSKHSVGKIKMEKTCSNSKIASRAHALVSTTRQIFLLRRSFVRKPLLSRKSQHARKTQRCRVVSLWAVYVYVCVEFRGCVQLSLKSSGRACIACPRPRSRWMPAPAAVWHATKSLVSQLSDNSAK